MPLITRLHTPESLGEYQFFSTMALVLIPIISGSFAFAIRGAQSDYTALISLKLGMQFSAVTVVILLMMYPLFAIILSGSKLEWFTVYIPALLAFVYLSANFQFAMAMYTNQRRYSSQSGYILSKSLLFNSLKLILSFFSAAGGSLVAAMLITETYQLLRIIGRNFNRLRKTVFRFRRKWFTSRLARSADFPTYMTMTTVVGILMNWFPILTAGAFYGAEHVGLLGLAFMVANTPVYPFVTALQTVCFGELSRHRGRNNLLSVYSKSMLLGVIPSVLGLIALGVHGERLFGLIFGEAWSGAGLYAFYSFIPMCFSLLLSPIYKTLNVFFSFQRELFLVSLVGLLAGLFFTSLIGIESRDFELFIIVYAAIVSASHVSLFLISIIIAARKSEGV